jgi:hypothetical protein
VVDPGMTDDSCNPDDTFQAKVIIVSSPDSRHWGRGEFSKRRGNICGFFFFFPTWELIELLGAQPVLKSAMLNGTVASRYREVGGVPRHIFAEDGAYNQATRNQTTGLNMLTVEQVKKIATLEIEDLSSMDTSQPKSSVMGYRLKTDNEYNVEEPGLISPVIAEKMYGKFMKDLWQTMLTQQEYGWKIFEAYTRKLMADDRHTFECRACVGKSNLAYNTKLNED